MGGFKCYERLKDNDIISEGLHELNDMFQLFYPFQIEKWRTLIQQEPKNPELYYKNAQVFARICDRKIDIIKKCDKMIDRALEFAPKNTLYLIEKGYYHILFSEIEKAFKYLLQAKDLDTNNKESSYHLIFCKILKDHLY